MTPSRKVLTLTAEEKIGATVLGLNSPATQKLLKREGLPVDTVLGMTSHGKSRHIAVTYGLELEDTVCNLFRRGTSLLRAVTVDDDGVPLCGACLRTLSAEVLRAREAMKNQKVSD